MCYKQWYFTRQRVETVPHSQRLKPNQFKLSLKREGKRRHRVKKRKGKKKIWAGFTGEKDMKRKAGVSKRQWLSCAVLKSKDVLFH